MISQATKKFGLDLNLDSGPASIRGGDGRGRNWAPTALRHFRGTVNADDELRGMPEPLRRSMFNAMIDLLSGWACPSDPWILVEWDEGEPDATMVTLRSVSTKRQVNLKICLKDGTTWLEPVKQDMGSFERLPGRRHPYDLVDLGRWLSS